MQAELEGMPKLLVFGGNGYVGTRVCEEALNTGLQIVSINRSGRPRGTDAWINEVDWVQVNPPVKCCLLMVYESAVTSTKTMKQNRVQALFYLTLNKRGLLTRGPEGLLQ